VQTLVQLLPPTQVAYHSSTVMTKHYMFDATLAIVMGTGIGMLLSVAGQKMLNKHYQSTCHKHPHHNLIYVQGFLGDQYYCINKAHFTSGQ
jgi:hypothetical protein